MIRIFTVPARATWFVLWFAGQLLASSARVLADVLTPSLGHTPHVVRLPLESRSDVQVALLGILITLTPGTLTLGVASHYGQSGRVLLVHSMYCPDATSAIAELRDLERRMLRCWSLAGAR